MEVFLEELQLLSENFELYLDGEFNVVDSNGTSEGIVVLDVNNEYRQINGID